MTFLAPLVLTGLAAAALPVAIHLITRSQVKVMRWAAMTFLLETVRMNERKMRIEDLLLLILRCLILGLLALAFARPALEATGRMFSATEPVRAMIVLDVSPSMAHNNGQSTRLDQAKLEAIRMVDALPAASAAGLILAGGTSDAVIPSPSSDLALVKRRLQLVEADPERSDLYPAIKLATDALRKAGPTPGSVHIFTDDTQSAWSRVEEVEKLRAANPGVDFIHHPLGSRETDNTSITNVTMDEPNPPAGEFVPVTASIKNWGTETVQDLRITAGVDRGAPQSEELISSLAPGEERNVRLSVRFDTPGAHTVDVESPADRMPADNSRSFAVRTMERPKILIVSDERAGASERSSAFFLTQALLPLPREQRDRATLSVLEKTPREAAALKLEDFQLVILCDLRDPSAIGIADALKAYVEGGGSLLILPGENATSRTPPLPESWNAFLPAVPGRSETLAVTGSGAALQTKGFVHPVMAPWNDSSMGNLGTVSVTKRFPLQLSRASDPASNPATILAFGDGTPALVEWTLGAGRVAVIAFPLQSEWTNLYLHPSFVAIAERLTRSLVAGPLPELNIAPNTGFTHPMPLDTVGSTFYVRSPANPDFRGCGQVEARGNTGVIQYRDTAKTGAYAIALDPKSPPSLAFAVQSAPDAGELRYVPEGRIAEVLKPPAGGALGEPTKLALQKSVSHELWFPLVILATLLAFAEMALAHRFSLPK